MRCAASVARRGAGALLPPGAIKRYPLAMPSIHVLKPQVARLIAAGEVIDRPQAVLRELLDNALDSGASSIEAEIEEGGIGKIRVVDNGCGMSAEDLELSILPHATSKIETADDLLSARTLGFRGEALASIAACAKLIISTKAASEAAGARLSIEPGAKPHIEAAAVNNGTQVETRGLFDNFPARRQFLKRPQTEAALCKQVFIDKALAHPETAFRFSSEGRLSFALVPMSLQQRLAALYHEAPEALLYTVRFSGQGFSGQTVIASPAFSRPDRRLMQVFVNGRRIQDMSLLQALDYSFSGFLPGGLHPCAFLFVDIDPALADFNIHPAKREARFKDIETLRRSIVASVQSFLLELGNKSPEKMSPPREGILELEPAALPGAAEPRASYWAAGSRSGGAAGIPCGSGVSGGWKDFEALRERAIPLPRGAWTEPAAAPDGAAAAEADAPTQSASASGQTEPAYIGTVLSLFLIVEWNDAVYLIDQHAAHERILFDEFSKKAPAVQELLVPAVFEPESETEAERLESLLPELAESGFALSREGGSFLVNSLPAVLKDDPIGAIREILRDLPEAPVQAAEAGAAGNTDSPPPGERSMRGGILRHIRATSACRGAIKDGEVLDRESARELALRALALPEPRCPHGRPLWVRLSREELYRLVRRTV